jgi:hypothetical protein
LGTGAHCLHAATWRDNGHGTTAPQLCAAAAPVAKARLSFKQRNRGLAISANSEIKTRAPDPECRRRRPDGVSLLATVSRDEAERTLYSVHADFPGGVVLVEDEAVYRHQRIGADHQFSIVPEEDLSLAD